jgi:RNA polymerase sigma-70 factor (ECF subfamily)
MIKNDSEIVNCFLTGDEKSFEVLVDRYMRPLYNFVFQIVQDRAQAEDIVQEIFVKVWKNLKSFDQNKKFSTWIFAIAKNTSFDFLKKKKSLPFSFFENEDGSNILEYIEDKNILHSEELFLKMDNKKELKSFLKKLSPKERSIISLYYEQGFSLVEIGEIFGSSSNTIKSIYRRSILNLRGKYFAKKSASEIV